MDVDGEESRPGGRPTCFACCGRSPRHPNGACSQLRWPSVQASSRFRPHRIAVLAAQGSSSSAGARERNGATAQSHHATQDFIQTPRLLQTWSFVRKALRPRADVPRRFTRRVPAGCISNALRCLAQQRAVKWMSRKICAALLLSVPPPSGPMQTSGSVQRLPLEGSRRRPGCPPDQIVHHGVADYAIQ